MARSCCAWTSVSSSQIPLDWPWQFPSSRDTDCQPYLGSPARQCLSLLSLLARSSSLIFSGARSLIFTCWILSLLAEKVGREGFPQPFPHTMARRAITGPSWLDDGSVFPPHWAPRWKTLSDWTQLGLEQVFCPRWMDWLICTVHWVPGAEEKEK